MCNFNFHHPTFCAQAPAIATNNPYNRKWNHYAKILEGLRDAPEGLVEKLGILPFILTTSGFIHEKSLTLPRDLVYAKV